MGPKTKGESWISPFMEFLQGARKSFDGIVSGEMDLHCFTLQLNVIFFTCSNESCILSRNQCFQFNLVSMESKQSAHGDFEPLEERM
jgi:hypothetical protein